MLSPSYAGKGASPDASAKVIKCPVSGQPEGKGQGPAGKSSFRELLGLLQAEYDSVAHERARLQRDVESLRVSLGDGSLSQPGPWCVMPLLPKDPTAPIPTVGTTEEGTLLEAKELEVARVPMWSPAVPPQPASGNSGSLGPDFEQPEFSCTPVIIGPEVLESWQVNADDGAGRDSYRLAKQFSVKAPSPSDLRHQTSSLSKTSNKSKSRAKPVVVGMLLGESGAPIGRSCDMLMLPPESRVRVLWDILGMIFLLFDMLHTPLMAFREPDTNGEFVLEWLTSVFWTMDIFFSFFRGYYRTCIVEMRASRIAKRYLKREFVPDCVICSLDWFMMWMKEELSSAMNYSRLSKTVRVARIVRILRLVRLLKLPIIIGRMSANLSESAASISAVVKSLLMILVTNHFIACLWYAVGSVGDPAWTDPLNDQDRGFWYRYLTSVHWSITQFTPASMEIQPKNILERTFAVCTIVIGLVMFSTFVSTITSSMSTLRKESQRRSTQIEIFRRYLSEHRISVAVSSRISSFLDSYRFSARQCVAKKEVGLLKALPKKLQLMVDWEVYQPVLCRHAFFDHCSELDPAAMLQICHSSVEEVSVASCEELFHCASLASAMYVTMSGEMEYFQGFSEVSPEYIDGRTHTMINEPALWLSWIHQGRVFALTACDFLRLSAENVTKVLVSYPELMCAGQQYARLLQAKMQEFQLEVPRPCAEGARSPSGSGDEARSAIASDLFLLDHGVGLEMVQNAFDFAFAASSESPEASFRMPSKKLVKQHARQTL